MIESLYLNSHNVGAADIAQTRQLRLEVDEFLFYNNMAQRSETELAQRLSSARKLTEKIERRILHGTIVSTYASSLSCLEQQQFISVHK